MELKPLGQPTPISAAVPISAPNRPTAVTGTQPPQAPPTSQDQVLRTPAAPGQAVSALAFVEEAAQTEPLTREDLAWFDALAVKMNSQNYQPTAEEAVRFNQIEMRLMAAVEPETLGPPSRAEVNWALGIEDKVKQGYQPNHKELTHYQDIAVRLFRADQTSPLPDFKTVSQAELAWAKALETKITKDKYDPLPEDIKNYEDIYLRFQAEMAQQKQQTPPSPADLQWAQALAEKITQGDHKTTPEEVERYTDIYNRHQATSGSGAKPSLSSEDVQWYTQLKDKMDHQGYQPTAEELDRAGKIIEIMYLNDPSLILPQDAPVAQHEQDWALRLRTQAEQGIPPSPEELERYEEIFNRYTALPQK